MCITRKKVLCHYCLYAESHKWFTTREGEKSFTEMGFDNWKKAVDKFKAHENSQSHKEAMLKWAAQKRPTIGSQLNTQLQNQQKERRMGLLKQIRAIQFLARQLCKGTLSQKVICTS